MEDINLHTFTFDEYSEILPNDVTFSDSMALELLYFSNAINGEAGELAEKVKKLHRDLGGKVTADVCDGIEKELGDILAYITMCSDVLGISLAHIARANIVKLLDRQKRGKLNGSGDNR